MELKEIFNIIDKTKSKLLKQLNCEDKDLNLVIQILLKTLAMQIKKKFEGG